MWKYNKCAKVLEYVSVLAFRSSILHGMKFIYACCICIATYQGPVALKIAVIWMKTLASWIPKEEEQEGGFA